MAGDPEQGLATAARLALGERGAAPGPDEDQLDLPGLLGLPAANTTVNEVTVARRPGTRAGILNKRTTDWLEYFSKRGYRLPIENLMALANLGVEELAKRLHCSPLEAINVIIRVNSEVAPYLHPRLSAIELKPPGELGGRPSTLEIEGSLVDVTPQPSPSAPTGNGDLG